MISRSAKQLLNHPVLKSLIQTPSSFSTTISSSSSDLLPKRLHHKDWLSPNEVVQVFTTLQDPNSVLTALHHYSKRKDYKPNEAIYTVIIHKLAHAYLFHAVDTVMDRIKAERNCRLSDDFFRGVIKAYGNVGGRVNKAMQTLYDMPIFFGCWPTVKTFNLVLHLLVSTKTFDAVHDVFLKAPQLGIEIDACCLNIIIKGLCESGKLDGALKVLDEFPDQKCQPNALTFSTLMHGLCVNGKVDEAFGLLERMGDQAVDPDAVTFNILIAGLRKQGRHEEGIKLLEKMKFKGCRPIPGTYQEVLYCYLDAQRFMEAKEFMIMLLSKRFCRPSFVSYKMLIRGLCKEKRVEDVDWVLRQMVRQGFLPKMGMWKQIIRCVFSENRNQCFLYHRDIVDGLVS